MKTSTVHMLPPEPDASFLAFSSVKVLVRSWGRAVAVGIVPHSQDANASHNENLYICLIRITLQGTNISHLGKRKIIFKSEGYVSSQEGRDPLNSKPTIYHYHSEYPK